MGDSQLTYMREAPVLKVGRRSFVGDRVEIDKPEGLIAINASVELMEDFARERVIEIWWKGTKRVTVHAVPVRLSPAQFSAACLRVPPSITRLASSGYVMRAVNPSTKPQLMDFIGGPSALSTNPFDVSDRERGSASFRIIVGRDGLIKQCDFLKRGGKLPERSTACERLRSWARFYPATDKAGVPAEAQADFAVNWAGIK